MRIHKSLLRAIPIACAIAFIPSAFADPAASQPAPAPLQPLTPPAQKALADLASDDFPTREAALLQLETALAEQTRAIFETEKPAKEITTPNGVKMTELPADTKLIGGQRFQTPTMAALEFQEGLARFLLDTRKHSADERQARIAFAFQPEVLPLIAQAYSIDRDQRVAGIKGLAKINSDASTELLGRFLTDSDRRVYVAAMEALWDRTPTDAIIDALWDRAVASGIAQQNGQEAGEIVMFRGEPIETENVYPDNPAARRSADNATACELLMHLKSPRIQEKVKAFLDTFNSSEEDLSARYMWMYGMNNPAITNAFQLIEHNKSPEILDALYKIATADAKMSSQGQARVAGGINGAYFFANRTSMLATFITLVGQKPEDYRLKRLSVRRGMWVTTAQEDEEKGVSQLKEWWAANKGKVGSAPPGAPETPGKMKPEAPSATRPGPAASTIMPVPDIKDAAVPDAITIHR